MRILITEDDSALAEALQFSLTQAGYAVDWVANGSAADEALKDDVFGLLILDLGLPKLDGFEVLRRLRRRNTSVPVLILSGREKPEEKVLGLDLGADDYLVKPFAFSELVARVRSLLRRGPASPDDQLRIEDLELDTHRNRAIRAGQPLHLTAKEFLLLAHLVRSAGEVVSRKEIEGHVWGIDFQTGTNVLDVMVRRLRAKVDDPYPKKLIHTVRGAGYVLRAD
jgi:two-component system copper resistance phosphate regulon response regulator CusR